MNQKSNIDGETQAIFQAEANLQTFTEHMQQIKRLKDAGKQEADSEFRKELKKEIEEHHNRARRLREQYEHHNKTKNEKLQRYFKEVAQEYKRTIKIKMKELEQELINLFIIY